MDFNKFLTLFQPDKEFTNRLGAAEREWNKCSPNKQQTIIAWLEMHGRYPGRNPYFFIQDFEARQQTMDFDAYYKKYGTTEDTDGWKRKFIENEGRTIYVKNNG